MLLDRPIPKALFYTLVTILSGFEINNLPSGWQTGLL